jgi:hypothetical protein
MSEISKMDNYSDLHDSCGVLFGKLRECDSEARPRNRNLGSWRECDSEARPRNRSYSVLERSGSLKK